MTDPHEPDDSRSLEKVKPADSPATGAEKKASAEAEGERGAFYGDQAKRTQALAKARKDGLRTGTHALLGTPTIEGTGIKGGAPSPATLTEQQLKERMNQGDGRDGTGGVKSPRNRDQSSIGYGSNKIHLAEHVSKGHTDKNKTSDANEARCSRSDAPAMQLIQQQLTKTEQKHRNSGTPEAFGKHDIQVKNDPRIFFQALGEFADTFTPGDLNQKWVKDLGIEPVPAADLKNSKDTTSEIDHALDKAHIDPKHYNCNDYVTMFVLCDKHDPKLGQYLDERKNRPLIAGTGSPETFLRRKGYEPISSGPLEEGDIIVIHGPSGEHTAVVCMDHKTHELYTMQKPNTRDVPVRLSLDQLCRAEKIADAESVEIYRKK